MALALYSLASNKRVKEGLAMTGELSLTGKVLPVGGIKEKVLASRRLGVFNVVLPRQNEKDVNEDLSPELKRELNVHYVSTIDEVLELALLPCSSTQSRKSTSDNSQVHEAVQ